MPVTISASVSGDINDIITFTETVNPITGQIIDGGGTPIPLDARSFLTYGDFFVNGGNDLGASSTTVGDGINDQTWWVFDFTSDANFSSFVNSTTPFVSGLLTLTLIPRESTATGVEGVFVPGLNGVYDVDLTGATIDGTVDALIQLVQPGLVPGVNAHDEDGILAKFVNGGTTGPSNALSFGVGGLPFKFFDDAHVLAANLELTRDGDVVSAPEPTTTALLAIGLVVMGIGMRRRLS